MYTKSVEKDGLLKFSIGLSCKVVVPEFDQNRGDDVVVHSLGFSAGGSEFESRPWP